jgi:hypothetical protein
MARISNQDRVSGSRGYTPPDPLQLVVPSARLEVPPGDQDEDQRVVDPYVTWTDDDQLFATSYYSCDGQHP